MPNLIAIIITKFQDTRDKNHGGGIANQSYFLGRCCIIAVVAVIEDLYVWMNGGESVFSKWMEGWGIFPDDVRKMIDTVIGYFSAMWDRIKADFLFLVNFITAVFTGDWGTVIAMIKQAFVQF
ncbi:hypothetical protein [Arsenophonus sp. PmNCSU2021_1]|uniref:hypothetical protein n=1 Tax=Arsenophonus sp. PmNCSU2021_1 TaxID=3118989 RepID=UPI002FF3CF56